jgi:hypothetical protein
VAIPVNPLLPGHHLPPSLVISSSSTRSFNFSFAYFLAGCEALSIKNLIETILTLLFLQVEWGIKKYKSTNDLSKKCTQKSFSQQTILPIKNLPKSPKNIVFLGKTFFGCTFY